MARSFYIVFYIRELQNTKIERKYEKSSKEIYKIINVMIVFVAWWFSEHHREIRTQRVMKSMMMLVKANNMRALTLWNEKFLEIWEYESERKWLFRRNERNIYQFEAENLSAVNIAERKYDRNAESEENAENQTAKCSRNYQAIYRWYFDTG